MWPQCRPRSFINACGFNSQFAPHNRKFRVAYEFPDVDSSISRDGGGEPTIRDSNVGFSQLMSRRGSR